MQLSSIYSELLVSWTFIVGVQNLEVMKNTCGSKTERYVLRIFLWRSCWPQSKDWGWGTVGRVWGAGWVQGSTWLSLPPLQWRCLDWRQISRQLLWSWKHTASLCVWGLQHVDYLQKKCQDYTFNEQSWLLIFFTHLKDLLVHTSIFISLFFHSLCLRHINLCLYYIFIHFTFGFL